MRYLPHQRQGRRAHMAKQRLARPPAAVTPAASPAAGSATAAAAPAASAILSNFGPARPAPGARLHIRRRPLPSRLRHLWPLSRLDTKNDSLPNPPSISACFLLRSRTVRRRLRPRDQMPRCLHRTDSSPRCQCVCVCVCVCVSECVRVCVCVCVCV